MHADASTKVQSALFAFRGLEHPQAPLTKVHREDSPGHKDHQAVGRTENLGRFNCKKVPGSDLLLSSQCSQCRRRIRNLYWMLRSGCASTKKTEGRRDRVPIRDKRP